VNDQEIPTLYEWAGGESAFRRLIDAFYDRAEVDELISPYFPGGVQEAHRAHVAAWWREVFGGPPAYTKELGGYDHMVARHRDLGITEEARARFVSLMSLAQPTMPASPTTRSSARRCWPTSSGGRGWPSPTRSREPR